MKKKISSGGGVAICAILMVVAVLVGHLDQANAMVCSNCKCNAKSMAPCLDAIKKCSPHPGKECCGPATEQYPCFCTFMEDPNIGKYFQMPGAKVVMKGCGLKWPSCK